MASAYVRLNDDVVGRAEVRHAGGFTDEAVTAPIPGVGGRADDALAAAGCCGWVDVVGGRVRVRAEFVCDAVPATFLGAGG